MMWPISIISTESYILVITAILLLKYYFHRRWSVLKEWGIPHDPPSFINLGHARNYLFSDNYFTYELECKKKFGPVWGYYLVTRPRIVVHDPSILRRMLIKEFSNFPNRLEQSFELDGEELANGVLMTNDDQWKRMRKTLTPAFSMCKFKQMIYIVNWCVDNTLSALRRKVETGDGSFETKDLFNRLSLDVICSAAFSTNVNSQDETVEEPSISKHAKAFFNVGFFNVAALLTLAFPWISPFLAGRGGRQEHVLYLKNVCQRMIERRETEPETQDRVDLMQFMIDSRISESELRNGAQKGMTSLEIVGNALTMLLAGYDTTATSMSYLAYNLTMHPTIQRRLQVEIDDMFEENEAPSFDTVHALKFLDMCVNESLRLYSTVQKTIRTAKNDITICGIAIRQGQEVNVPIYALCHDPEFWDAPMEFNPERMADMSEIDPMVFQPFGSGPRNCIGARFALMEIKLAFCSILRRYTFKPTPSTPKPPLQLRIGITTSPKVNFRLRVVPRG